MFGTQSPNMSQHPQCEAWFFMAFHGLFVCRSQNITELMSKGYNLVKLFNTLQWHQVTCTIYFFDSEVCILTGAGKNENDRKAIYVVMICNVYIYTSIFLMCRFSAPLLFDSDFSPSGQFQPLRNISAPLVSWKLPIKKDLHTNTLVQKNQ